MSCCMSVNVRLIINHMILYKKSTSITYLKYLGTRVAYNFIFRTKAASINMIDWTINYRYFRHHKWQKSGSVNNLAVTLKSQINHLKLKTYHQRQSIPLKNILKLWKLSTKITISQLWFYSRKYYWYIKSQYFWNCSRKGRSREKLVMLWFSWVVQCCCSCLLTQHAKTTIVVVYIISMGLQWLHLLSFSLSSCKACLFLP